MYQIFGVKHDAWLDYRLGGDETRNDHTYNTDYDSKTHVHSSHDGPLHGKPRTLRKDVTGPPVASSGGRRVLVTCTRIWRQSHGPVSKLLTGTVSALDVTSRSLGHLAWRKRARRQSRRSSVMLCGGLHGDKKQATRGDTEVSQIRNRLTETTPLYNLYSNIGDQVSFASARHVAIIFRSSSTERAGFDRRCNIA